MCSWSAIETMKIAIVVAGTEDTTTATAAQERTVKGAKPIGEVLRSASLDDAGGNSSTRATFA